MTLKEYSEKHGDLKVVDMHRQTTRASIAKHCCGWCLAALARLVDDGVDPTVALLGLGHGNCSCILEEGHREGASMVESDDDAQLSKHSSQSC